MAPAGTITAPPRVNLLVHAGVVSAEEDMQLGQLNDLGWPDKISDEIGRPGFIEGYVLDGCLVAAEDPNHDHEPAVFDRYYYAEDGEDQVLVDILPGGSDLECKLQEAEKHVSLKRRWCEAHGMAYQVIVAMTSPVPLG